MSADDSTSILARLKSARLVRVLAVYLGASWVVIQVVEVFQDGLGLPTWLLPVALILLGVGLLIVLVTAWVQSRPGMEAREAAGEVPDDWEVGLSDATASLARGELPHPTWARAIAGGVFAFALLFGGAGLYVVIQDRGESFQPPEILADEAGLSLAVLPFLVSGDELEEWEEGMADLLSTGLDGAGGLRSVDTRTILARWEEAVPQAGRPDLETLLGVADAVGARFALEGSVNSIGGEARLVVRIHDMSTGGRLGSAQVDGSLEDPHDLVDRLALNVLRILLGGNAADLPRVELAAVTTSSSEALRAYLRGERAYRQGAFGQAIREYQEAVTIDSTFALAHHRLGLAAGWPTQSGVEGLAAPARERARELSDRLPERERLLVEGYQVVNRSESDPTVVSSPIDEVVRLYPTDAEAHYLMAETYYHSGMALKPISEVEHSFEMAVEMDSGFAPYRIHLTEMAFFLEGDSALAAERVAEYRTAVGNRNDAIVVGFERGLRAHFGNEEEKTAVLDSLRLFTPPEVQGLNLLSFHPGTLDVQEAAIREAIRRTEGLTAQITMVRDLGRFLANRGRHAEALATLNRPAFRSTDHRACLVMELVWEGVEVPEERLDETMAGATDPEGSFRRSFCAALAAAELGSREGFDRGVARLRELAAESAAARDEVPIAEAYWRWKRGETPPAEAARELRAVANSNAAPYWPFLLGEMYLEAGQLGDAADAYTASLNNAYIRYFYMTTWYRLAGIYDEIGDVDLARDAWEKVVLAWEDGDPAVQPMVEEARARLAALE